MEWGGLSRNENLRYVASPLYIPAIMQDAKHQYEVAKHDYTDANPHGESRP